MSFRTVSLAFMMTAASPHGTAEMFNGVEFPAGAVSFADRVISTAPSNPGPTDINFTDPAKTVGKPDYSGGASGTGSYTLGHGGSIILEFRDNRLTGDGTNKADLYIFEVWPFTEPTFVFISENGSVYLPIGKVAGS